MTEPSNSIVSNIIQLAVLLGLFAIFFWRVLKSSERKRVLKQQKKDVKNEGLLERKVIILAFQILNLFVHYSTTWRTRYTPIQPPIQKNTLKRIWKFITGFSPCYLPRFSKKAIRIFFRDLKVAPNVKVMIYTKLQAEVCNKILVDLGIDSWFDEKDIIYVKEDQLKNAEDVDHDTGRVIIISANNQDQDRMLGNNHGLILALEERQGKLDDDYLFKLGEFFSKLLEKGRKDLLHEQMHELAQEMNLPICIDDFI